MILSLVFYLVISSGGGQGASCRVDADCAGGLLCDRQICIRAAAPPPAYDERRSGPAYDERRPEPYDERRSRETYRYNRPSRWKNGDPIPSGYHVESRPRLGLIIGGGVTLGAFWLLEWTSTVTGCRGCTAGNVAFSFVPVVGPFLQLSQLNFSCANGRGCDPIIAPFMVIDGVVQIVGFGLLLGGLLSSHDVLVYNGPGDMQGTLMPMPLKDGFGLATVGHF